MQLPGALFQENERTAPALEGRRVFVLDELRLDVGQTLAGAQVAYEAWGELNTERDNAIMVCHAVSGDSHAVGWWDRIVGPGKPIDTDRYFVICSNTLGGCQGSLGPGSVAADGKRFGSRFPSISVSDMVRLQKALAASLGIESLLGVCGGSMGGMQALEWAKQGGVRKVLITAAAARHSAMQIGFNEAARQAILRDPKWLGGDYPAEDPPKHGLAVARMIGHLSYLSDYSFQAKFGRAIQESGPRKGAFQVESYLNYQGDRFTDRFDAGSFVTLTNAIDAYDCDNLQAADAEFLFVSFTSDWLYPSYQAQEMHEMAVAAGCASTHQVLDVPFGHDSFLLDAEGQGSLFRRFLEGESL